MNRAPAAVWLALAALLPGSLARAGDNWPRFRGPDGAGHAAGPFTGPVDQANVAWREPLPGTGHSSPVVWGDRVYLTSADADAGERYVVCLAADTGKAAWRHTSKLVQHRKHRDNSFASCTPAADELGVYAVFTTPQEYALLALTPDGKERWKQSLGRFDSTHGGGSSPVVHGDLVIVNDDQESAESALVAFDRTTGQQRWRLARPSTKKAAMSTPALWRPKGGGEQIVITTWGGGIQGVDPLAGRLLWSAKDVFFSRPIGSPQCTDELIVGVCGEGNASRSLVTVRPDPSGVSDPKVLYKIDQLGPHVPTPLVHGDRLILLNDLGLLTSADLATGKVRWSEKVGGTFYGSPVLVGDTLWAMSRQGELVGVNVADGYKPVGRLTLGSPSHATPAVAGGRMYLRTTTHLICLKGK